MGVGMVTTREHHARVRRHLQVEAVEDALALVHFAQLLVQVLRHVECLHRVFLVADVPDHDRQVVSRVNVCVVRWRELGPRYRVDYIGEKVLSGRVFRDLERGRAASELRTLAHVTQADVVLA